jgi:hypothetical protein
MELRNCLRLVAAVVVLCGHFAFAQQRSIPQAPNQLPQQQQPPIQPPGDTTLQRMQEQAARARNLERQKLIVQDTQQLLKLANELNDAVGKTNENTLSLEVVRKAEEIEKLAKHVKDKMKGDY